MQDFNSVPAELDTVLLETPDELLSGAAKERKDYLLALQAQQSVQIPQPDGTVLEITPSIKAPPPILTREEAIRIGMAHAQHELTEHSLHEQLTSTKAELAVAKARLEALNAEH